MAANPVDNKEYAANSNELVIDMKAGDVRVQVGAIDRISMLPNELLVSVLCLLSLKEATASSVVSRGWRYLHTFATKLDFHGREVLPMSPEKCEYKYFEEQRRKYLRWVDGVVGLNQSSNLEEFRVTFFLSLHHAQHIDNWVGFALSRRVKTLELHLIAYKRVDCIDMYVLNLQQYLYNNKNQYYNLRKFSTYRVNVSGEGVEMLLRNCPLLEHVSMGVSAHLLSLDIQKPFPAFKRLDIVSCRNLSWVVVRDSNIESVMYWGGKANAVNWTLVNVPHLTKLWVGGRCTQRAEEVVRMFSSVLPQLHSFKIILAHLNYRVDCGDFCLRFRSSGVGVVEMTSLKQLVVDVDNHDNLLPLIHLIKASPRLQRFVIEEPYERDRHAHDHAHDEFVEEGDTVLMNRKIPKAYPSLKEIKFVGYRGASNHLEIVKHLVENAIALQTILVDPWRRNTERHWEPYDIIYPRKFDNTIFTRVEALKQQCVALEVNIKIL